jgi:hypothetical protein
MDTGIRNSIRMGSRAFQVLVHERTRECIWTDDYGLENLIEMALQRGVWFLLSGHGKVCIENAILVFQIYLFDFHIVLSFSYVGSHIPK